MVNKRSLRRHKAYLRKIWYLRNFLNLLKFYRAYLNWKHIKRLKRAIKWHTNDGAICWKTFAIRWNLSVFNDVARNNNYKNVIYWFFGCQLTTTLSVISPSMFRLMHDELIVDKTFVIFFTHETVWSYCLHAFLTSLRAQQQRKLFYFIVFR